MRTREFDTRQAISNAMEVFWRKGYKGASMTELLAAMGIGKGSFYAAFGSKHELYLQALRHFRDTGMLFKHSTALSEAKFAQESIKELFDQLIKRTINEQKTCMLGKAALDFRGQDPQVAEIVDMGVSQLEKAILEILSKAQATGEIAEGRDLKVLSSYLTAAFYGIQVLGGAKPCRENLEQVVATVLSIVFPSE
ncbi:TetR/AcrR family transcriptional regulator [Methylosoma difficile]|jgi:TetR/AcrR family transcriptional repressor of nem operon